MITINQNNHHKFSKSGEKYKSSDISSRNPVQNKPKEKHI